MSNKEVLHIYRRVSTQEQSTKYSLTNQLDCGIQKANELGMNYRDWNEEGVSGSSEKIEDREVLTELYSELQQGVIKHLYVYDLSRLSRNPMVSSHLRKELEDHQVKLYTNESNVDFQSDEQVLMYDFFSSINQFYVRVQRKKSMMGKVSHFKRGGWRGGTFPFGYEGKKVDGIKKLVINPEESKWVRQIYDWYNQDISIKEISRKSDKNGISPRRGQFWSGGSLLVILKNKIYIGIDEMVDKITNPSNPKILNYRDEELQIIDSETFNSVQNKIELSLSKKNQLTKVVHDDVLLRGLLFCGDCGEIYGCRVKPSKNEFYYYCRSRENNWRKIDDSKKVKCSVKKSLNIKNTDEHVWLTLVELLGDSNLIKESFKKEVLKDKGNEDIEREEKLLELKRKKKYLNNKIEELEERDRENRNWYLSGDIDRTQFEDGKRIIKQSREERFLELEKLNLNIQNIVDSKKWIDWLDKHTGWINNLKRNFTLDEKKDIIKTYINKIEVNYDFSINQHKLKIHLKLPIVGDSYNIIKGGKNRVYEIRNGQSIKELDIPLTKAGRKKKVVESLNFKEVETIPPIKTDTSPSSSHYHDYFSMLPLVCCNVC